MTRTVPQRGREREDERGKKDTLLRLFRELSPPLSNPLRFYSSVRRRHCVTSWEKHRRTHSSGQLRVLAIATMPKDYLYIPHTVNWLFCLSWKVSHSSLFTVDTLLGTYPLSIRSGWKYKNIHIVYKITSLYITPSIKGESCCLFKSGWNFLHEIIIKVSLRGGRRISWGRPAEHSTIRRKKSHR